MVIKKDTDVSIDNEIGEIFKEHNILEYKSPQDHLDIDTFYKVGAQANWEMLEELGGDGSMSETLLELFMPIVESLVEARIGNRVLNEVLKKVYRVRWRFFAT